MCKMPIGVENFRELMEGNYYFVDKTLFIGRKWRCGAWQERFLLESRIL